MTEVNNDTLITKTDRTGKNEFRKQNNCEKLNTQLHAKFPATILKNPYYIPPPPPPPPPCNTNHVITPLGDMTCCISDLSHTCMQN